MHELSICASIRAIVDDYAAGRPVRSVNVDIGHLRQVVPDTLRFSWDIVVDGSPLSGSELVVNHIPATLRCHTCGESTTVVDPVFRCPCGSGDTTVTTGRELQVTSLELDDRASEDPVRT